MPEIRNIVILGASYAGLSASHYFLKHVYPRLPKDPENTYKVVLADPSAKWYFRVAAPRAVASAELMPIDKVFFDTEAGFKQYGDKVDFIQGKAINWDEQKRIVTVEKADKDETDIPYWALILATGSKTESPILSLQGTPHTEIEAAVHSFHKQLSSAKDIIVVGGGAAGVETAGELGESLNGAAGWFSSRPSNPKVKITLLTNSSRLLPQLRQSASDQAEIFLARVGVDVRYDVKVASIERLPEGGTRVVLHDGEQLHTDVYLPATGVKPMSGYVPEHLKNKKGYVINNESTLRVDAAGPRVYAFGDVASYSRDGIFDIMYALPALETNIERDLLAAHTRPNAKPTGPDRVYVKDERETQIVPVGRSKGVGALFGWRVPSIFVWLIKGRDFMVSSAHTRVDGSALAKEVPWKQ